MARQSSLSAGGGRERGILPRVAMWLADHCSVAAEGAIAQNANPKQSANVV
ncbi:MAG TPA: hypothetical protein VGL01_22885 [Trinickia sp.]|jgi:hypothetical protein|uniref:hypothetical protein n=1 Tax=Trinickia sp. TaxID=2571163 RepID=UPI002F4096F1